MKSPFPGMDPYLEAHWPDVHTKLVAYSAEMLNTSLPADLVAATEERVAIESDEGRELTFIPDVRVVEPPEPEPRFVETGGATAVATPYRLLAQVEPITERFIRVIEAGSEHLVTVIEFVSPTNKKGAGLAAFRSKRAELVAYGVNFVEIDLVRDGDWERLLAPFKAPKKGITPYRVSYRLAEDPGAVHFLPISLREPLPSIVIPLRPDDPQLRLELQPLLDHAYTSGRYPRRLDYTKPLSLLLAPDDAAWSAELLRDASKR